MAELTPSPLRQVTLTGADDSTDPRKLIALSRGYPFAEWGILLSHSAAGTPRFPSSAWISRFLNMAAGMLPPLCLHICGRWVREICKGRWNGLLLEHTRTLRCVQRVQLNFHSAAHHLVPDFGQVAKEVTDALGVRQVIFQCDGVNNHLVRAAAEDGLTAVPLYDRSGGAGILPPTWPLGMPGVYNGYAGGLGPDNVLEQLPKIAAVARGPHWIDMETHVRSDNDRVFDLDKCAQVLKLCEQHIQLS